MRELNAQLASITFSGSLADQVQGLKLHMITMMRCAELRQDLRGALAAGREVARCLEIEARLAGDIGSEGDRPVIIIHRDVHSEVADHELESNTRNTPLIVLPDNDRGDGPCPTE